MFVILRSFVRLLASVVTGLAQLTATAVVLWLVYMWLALLDCGFGIDGLFALVLFQPVLGIVIVALTIGICFCLGLPIRLSRSLRSWWVSHWFVGMGLFFTGTFLCLTSRPDGYAGLVGWFFMGFSLLHAYLPRIAGPKKAA